MHPPAPSSPARAGAARSSAPSSRASTTGCFIGAAVAMRRLRAAVRSAQQQSAVCASREGRRGGCSGARWDAAARLDSSGAAARARRCRPAAWGFHHTRSPCAPVEPVSSRIWRGWLRAVGGRGESSDRVYGAVRLVRGLSSDQRSIGPPPQFRGPTSRVFPAASQHGGAPSDRAAVGLTLHRRSPIADRR